MGEKYHEFESVCGKNCADAGFSAGIGDLFKEILAAIIPILTNFLSTCFNKASDAEVEAALAEDGSRAQAARRLAIKRVARDRYQQGHGRMLASDKSALFDGIGQTCRNDPKLTMAAAREFNQDFPVDDYSDLI